MSSSDPHLCWGEEKPRVNLFFFWFAVISPRAASASALTPFPPFSCSCSPPSSELRGFPASGEVQAWRGLKQCEAVCKAPTKPVCWLTSLWMRNVSKQTNSMSDACKWYKQFSPALAEHMNNSAVYMLLSHVTLRLNKNVFPEVLKFSNFLSNNSLAWKQFFFPSLFSIKQKQRKHAGGVRNTLQNFAIRTFSFSFFISFQCVLFRVGTCPRTSSGSAHHHRERETVWNTETTGVRAPQRGRERQDTERKQKPAGRASVSLRRPV